VKGDETFNTIKCFINAIDEKEFLLQKELWQNGFIIDLFKNAQSKMSRLHFDKLETKLFVVADNAGFGVGEHFYKLLPEVIQIYLNSSMQELDL